jgi:hypothetical protein
MAVAAALGAVGVPVLAPERRERSERREPGTQPVTSYTESLLNACQAIWWAPPEYRPHWEAEPDVIELAERQRAALREVQRPALGALWFDQRLPLLLDLWLGADPLVGAAVLVWSSPEDAVVELAKDGIRRAHALALWEHAARHALTSLIGSDVFVCRRGDLAGANPAVWTALGSFLQTWGLEAGIAGPPVLAADSPLAHETTKHDAHPALVTQLTDLAGAHRPLPELDDRGLGARLGPDAEELLDAHRAAYRIGVEARRAWRAVDRNQREVARLEAELTQTMDGVNLLVDRLLNAV